MQPLPKPLKEYPLYFGVWDPAMERGHFLFSPSGTHVFSDHQAQLPQRLQDHHLDSGYCRGVRSRRNPPDKEQVQGLARLHRVEGWTLIAFWDRSGDSRFASNSALLVFGEHTFEEMVGIFEKSYPKQWSRLQAAGGVRLEET